MPGQFLKQSTSVVISLGPFVDKTDGVTLETGLVSALDHASTGIMLSKNGGTLAVRHATVTASTYDAHGCYKVTLDTTDTGTLGKLRVIYTDAATCLPVWRDFEVVPAMVYDSIIAGSDRFDVNVTHIADTAQTARDIGASVLLSSGTGTGQVKLSSGYVAPNWGDVGNPTTAVGLTGTTISTTQAVASVSGNVGGNVVGSVGSVTGAVGSVTGNVGGNVAGSVGSVTSRVTANTDQLGGAAVTATTSVTFPSACTVATTTGAVGSVTGAVGSVTGTVGGIAGTTTTLDALQTALNSAHGSGSWATATGFSTHSAADVWSVATRVLTANTNLNDPTAAAIADAVWEEAIADHSGTAGSTAEQLAAAGAGGDPWSTAVPGAYSAGTAGYILGTNLNATVSSRSSHAATDIVSGGAITTSGGVAASDIISISGDATAANNLEAILDGTGGTGLTLSTLTVTAGVTVTQSTTDGHGVSVTGNGAGNALYLVGGATGDGIHTAAGATSGYGVHIAGSNMGSGLFVQGGSSGSGVVIYGGTSGGYAVSLVSQASSVAGLSIATNGGYAIDAAGGIYATVNAIAWNPTWDAEVQSECNDALVAIGLDHLISASVAGTDITDNSIIAKLVSKSATADWDTYSNTTDSLEAIRDRGDSAWITATGFSTHSAADVWAVATRVLTANTNLNDPTAAAIADAVWDEARTGHTTSGTFGFYIDAAISGISGGGGDATAANQSTIITHLTDIKGAGWSNTTDTLEKLADAIAALPNVTAIWAALTNAAANKIADHVLRRPLASARASSDGDAVAFRSALGALAKLVNKLERTGGHLYSYEEDDSTPFGDQTVGEDANASPITSLDTN